MKFRKTCDLLHLNPNTNCRNMCKRCTLKVIFFSKKKINEKRKENAPHNNSRLDKNPLVKRK